MGGSACRIRHVAAAPTLAADHRQDHPPVSRRAMPAGWGSVGDAQMGLVLDDMDIAVPVCAWTENLL